MPGLIGYMNPAVAEAANGRTVPAKARGNPPRTQTMHNNVSVPFTRLPEFLATDDEPLTYRIDRLWPVGARVVLAAQYKAGKSTLVANLIRALIDSEPFLSEYAVEPAPGTVALIDDELDQRTLRRWLRQQDITNTEAVAVLPLRGNVAAFRITDDANRGDWAHRLRDTGCRLLIVDCMRPILDATGLSEDKDAGRWLVTFDALLAEAGIGEALVTHHTGHQGERSRGDSRIRDWPDVEWRIVRQGDEPSAPRSFTAYGRDVDVPRSSLRYDQGSRRLTITPEPPPSPDSTDLSPAGRKLLEALSAMSEPVTTATLVDWIAERYGHGLRRETCSRELNAMHRANLVDYLDDGRDRLWFKRDL